MNSDLLGCTYLLHFDEPIGRSRHYLGWTNDLDKRLREHRKGPRERCVLTHEARSRGIDWIVAVVWGGVTIAHKMKLKAQKNSPRLCSICQSQWENR